MSEIDEIYLAEIMNSKFTLIDGLLLRDGAWNEDTLKEWSDTLKGNGKAIESIINHVHLTQFFWLGEKEYLEESDLSEVGFRIQDSWKRRLEKDFPDKCIEVIFNSETEEDGFVGNMNVTVHQVEKSI